MRISLILISIFTAPFTTSKEMELVSVQVLFRHGARAPSERLTNPDYNGMFPRGLGEMTDRGFNNSYILGQYLRKRYVDTGFLDKNLVPNEMYWRSVNKNRCLITASTVGASMFEDPVRHLHVPVITEEIKEQLLNYNQNNCPRELELIKEKCSHFDGVFHPWPVYEEFIANCLNYSHPVFKEYPFHTIEAHINEYKNGISLPPLIAQHINEIMSIYVNVTQFITGTGNHHDPRMMKVKFGFLVKTLIDNFEQFEINKLGKKENGLELEEKDTRLFKFMAYSTQDWILMGVLDSFGVLNNTVGLETYPEYNSMIIMELYKNESDNFFVKMYYKKEEITSLNHDLIDVTHLIRNCPRDQKYCPIFNFISCCSNYQKDEGQGCETENGKRKRARRAQEKKQKFQFSGPK